MSVKGGPDIVTDGLVFNLDAAGAVSDKGYPINGLPVEYLIVAGGGGGGGVIGGGGGAGGLLHGYTRASLSTGSYTVTVGAGGAGGTGWNTVGQGGNLGGDSSAFSITSTGGGGGVHHGGAATSTNRNGGSGGGGALPYSGQGGTGIAGQGNNGGNNGDGNFGAGGGGAGSVGANRTASYGGNGGLGKYYGYSFGRSLGYDGWFADGGAGGVRSYGGPIGAGVATHGGGNGTRTTVVAENGSTNTGSGGGGGGYSAGSSSRIGGNGGSGVVIIKYKGPQKATGGDSIITRRGYTIHVFTSSGTFTVGGRVAGLSTSKIVGTLENMDSTNYNSGNKGYFSLSADEYININSLTLTGNITVTAWIFMNSGGVYQHVVDSSNNSWHLAISSSNRPYLYVGPWSNSGVQLSISQWYMIAGVYDNDNSTLKYYVNGNLSHSMSASVNLVTNNVNIGRWQNGGRYFNGSIAHSSIYNKALFANEIEQNYNATKGRFGL